MLQLKKVQILGFKSFCDRTEVVLEGHGVTAIVGPNGCGKSNISDAITWVLGEQSAKSLRGIKMEDIIFAGTRERRPTGMAEVSLTLVDPAVYQPEPAGVAEPAGAPELAGDWDETHLREQSAQETDEAVADAQPGQTYEAESAAATGTGDAADDSASVESEKVADNVVLKVRRRRFGRAPVRAGEITVTRRLFRSGESEYLLNGKMCRLRDIQDIFLGTGLGGDSYAIIGQERIGQLLSSKPLDRRSIIEEAAGITRFKAKKRLAELRLESARGNLSRVNDIFEEVTRQVTILKRQAAKAERFGELRTEFLLRLRVVLASRLAQTDAESAALRKEIGRLGGLLEQHTAELATLDAEHTAATVRRDELDRALRDTSARAGSSAVELERTQARAAANAERIQELEQRLAALAAELDTARDTLAQLAGEREQHRLFLESATGDANAHRQSAHAQQTRAREAMQGVLQAEATAEQGRRHAMQAMQRAGQARQEIAQAEAALGGLDRESERLGAECAAARGELDTLAQQREAAKAAGAAIAERLRQTEAAIVQLRQRMEQRRMEETQSRRGSDGLRAELATLAGRRSSLEALIREHSYSTDTVRNLFRANARRGVDDSMAPVGTLADFLEVDGRYETVVDEFLRDELNFVVVKSWEAAAENVRMLHGDVAGRATFLVHPSEAESRTLFPGDAASAAQPDGEGVVPLRECVRVLNGFGRTLEGILPRLREGFVAPDSETARSLALRNPTAYFLSPTGETFHNLTVTGGKPRTQGPLALKRELAELQGKVEGAEARLAENERTTAALAREIGELTTALDGHNHERRDTEREAANAGAALRQSEGEAGRIERRMQEWQAALARNKDQRQSRQELVARRRAEAERLQGERERLERETAGLSERLTTLRLEREELQATASAAQAALAGLEERRRNAGANADRTERLYTAAETRIAQIQAAIGSATEERGRREEETTRMGAQARELADVRGESLAAAERLQTELTALRARTGELDVRLRALRTETDGLRERRSAHETRDARLSAELEHVEAACVQELSLPADDLRQDASITRLAEAPLEAEDLAARGLRKKMEAMGPVNMMALDELREASERYTHLEVQRRDLLDAIENTSASIREIDHVSREKFDEAFRMINDNFSATFLKLFGGGQAFMRLTDTEDGKDQDLAGIDIIASPPGKKLQNVLLLSGGEKALTALALLVATFQFQPAPFCVLDEVDAPLDETNIGRFARLIAEMSDHTQFVVITHSKRTMEQADVMYGVTMQEPGVSKVVSVSLGGRSRGKEARSAA